MRTSAHSLPAALSLRANFSWTFAGNVIYAACQWGMLVVLAKLGNPEMVGEFGLALAITGPIFMFANLRLWHIQATDARVQYRFGDYLGLRLITTMMALVLIAGFMLFPVFRWETALVLLSFGIARTFDALSEVNYGLLMQCERLDRVAKSMMMRGPLSFIALGIGVYVTGNVVWGVFGLAAGWALVLFFYDTRSTSLVLKHWPKDISCSGGAREQDYAIRPHWEKNIIMEMAWLALPLGIVTLLISLNVNIPRYFVEGCLGKRELGIFVALASIQQVGPTVVTALGSSASARLSRYYASGESVGFRNLLVKLVGISTLLGVAGVVVALIAGRKILSLIYGPEYALVGLLVWLMAAAGIDYLASTLHFGMMAARYFRVQLPLFLIVTGVVVLACIWLVPLYGLSGAAMALLLAGLVRVLGSLGIVLHAFGAMRKDDSRIYREHGGGENHSVFESKGPIG